MNRHISKENLFRHINHILPEIEPEQIDAHLLECDSCRAAADALTAEHQMIWQSVLTNLGQVNPTPEANFAAIAPRLPPPNKPISFSLHAIWQTLASGAVLAIFIIGLLIYVNSLRPMNMFGDGGSYLPIINGSFENIDADDVPEGWVLAGKRPQDYVAHPDDTVIFTGKSSALLASDVEEAREFGTLMQSLTLDESLRGLRVRLSAHIKTEDVTNFAGLWMRVDGGYYHTLQFDNMQDRPIRGTTDWQRYEIVLDVPQEGETIYLGVLLRGNGRVWIDNIQLEGVSNDVASTDYLSRHSPSNLDLEAGQSVPTGWFQSGFRLQDYEISRDTTTFVAGEASAMLASIVEDAPKPGALVQSFSADNYLGQRVRLSAQIKTENVSGWTGLMMQVGGVSGSSLQYDDMQNRGIIGTTDWSQYEVVLDVPQGSKSIGLGLLLTGSGRVWIDDVTLEVVGLDVPTTDQLALPLHPINLDFEEVGTADLPDGWIFDGRRPQDYDVRQDSQVFATGEASALLAAKVEDPSRPGLLIQSFDPSDYLGERVRFSAQIKTEVVTDWAGLWMSVGRSELEVFQFDNMQNRPIVGTTDWMRYEIVLDIPTASEKLDFGVMLAGNGRVWIDNITLEIVSDDVPSTHCQECWEESN
ncbi:MAG: hypothetical protein GY943_34940 [Chloroflexi bacterium]|nr:hypothetical protein [Chloroflexota bacterium]